MHHQSNLPEPRIKMDSRLALKFNFYKFNIKKVYFLIYCGKENGDYTLDAKSVNSHLQIARSDIRLHSQFFTACLW
jgi:hypothetical protein